MELCNFLRINNLNSFTEVLKVLSVAPYFLTVKDDSNFPDLYLLSYDKKHSDMSIPLVRECRGIILEKNTNKVVCYTFNKSIDVSFNNIVLGESHEIQVPDNFDYSSAIVEESIDGTQIRLFYYNDMWCVATTRCIDAKRSYWYSARSFYDLFQESCVGLDLGLLKTDHCYSFVLKHPENRIVVNYIYPSIVHVGTRNLDTLCEVIDNISVNKPERFNFNTFTEVVMSAMNSLSYDSEGYIVRDANFNRIKIKSKKYLELKNMRGNSNNLLYHYFTLRQSGALSEYIIYYPEDINQYRYLESNLSKMVHKIHKEYINRYINPEKVKVSWQFRPIIYKLHGDYLKSHEVTTRVVVQNYINSLQPAQICFLYNKTYQINNKT
jgi:hypothetical protein